MLKKSFYKGTLTGRILLIYIFCMLIPIIIATSYFTWKLEGNIRDEEKNNLKISLERASSGLESCFMSGMQIGNYVALDGQIRKFVTQTYTSQLEFYREFDQNNSLLLSRYAGLSDTVKEIMVYAQNPTLYNAGGYRRLDESVKKQKWYQQFINSSKQQILASGVEKENLKKEFNIPYISMISKEIDSTNQLKGVLLVRLNLNIQSIYKILNSEKDYFQFYLLNEEDEIVLSTNREYEPVSIQQLQDYGDIQLPKDGTVYESHFTKTKLLDQWKLVGIANRNNAMKRLSETRINIFLVSLMCALGSAILTSILAYSYTKRIKLLRNSIENVKNQKYEQIAIKNRNDDMGKLITTYNLMSDRIDKLVNEVYKLEIEKKDLEIEQIRAELNFLQSQLNPHFLFNTLNALLVVSMKNNFIEIIPILRNLSKLMRRLLNWSDEQVTIMEEISFVEMYLENEKFRFKEKLNYKIDISPDVYESKIPKMTIQPLVENACKHGIQKNIHGGTIIIRVYRQDKNLYIHIEDDGLGISEEKIQEIQNSFLQPATTNLCVGIRNVYRRLLLYYKQNVQFIIKNRDIQGTEIVIILHEE